MKSISGRRAFTLIEMLITIGVIAVLAALSIPGITYAKQYANSSKCTGNLKQLSMAFNLYATDNSGFLPYNGSQVVPSYAMSTSDTGPYFYLNVPIAGYLGYSTPRGQRVLIKELLCPAAPRAEVEANAGNFASYFTVTMYYENAPSGIPSDQKTFHPFKGTDAVGSSASGINIMLLQSNAGTFVSSIKDYNMKTVSIGRSLSNMVLLMDCDQAVNPAKSFTEVQKPMHRKRNVLFFDGHVEAY